MQEALQNTTRRITTVTTAWNVWFGIVCWHLSRANNRVEDKERCVTHEDYNTIARISSDIWLSTDLGPWQQTCWWASPWLRVSHGFKLWTLHLHCQPIWVTSRGSIFYPKITFEGWWYVPALKSGKRIEALDHYLLKVHPDKTSAE